MIKTLIVDDSAASRRVITRILESIPDVQIVDTADNGQDALKKTVRLRPDLITLDLEMPKMDGFTFLRWVMTSYPTPVIVVSSRPADESVFKALDLGALDFVVKPKESSPAQLEIIRSDLLEKVLAVPLIAGRNTRERMLDESRRIRDALANAVPSEKPFLVGMAASTGGPGAIQTVLENLPPIFDVPILVAQHMPAGFTRLFAERLNRQTSLIVQEAREGARMEPGTVWVAPGGKHLRVEKDHGAFVLTLLDHTSAHRFCPSGDDLFHSLAEAAGSRTIGAVLTGMGNDGKEGLRRIKQKGGITIAESQKTAVVFGMPGEAIRAGMADHVLPLEEIPNALQSFCKISTPETPNQKFTD